MNGPPRVSSSVLHPRWPLLSFSLFSRYASYLGLRPAAAPRGSEWEWDTSEVMWRVGMNGEQERSEVRQGSSERQRWEAAWDGESRKDASCLIPLGVTVRTSLHFPSLSVHYVHADRREVDLRRREKQAWRRYEGRRLDREVRHSLLSIHLLPHGLLPSTLLTLRVLPRHLRFLCRYAVYAWGLDEGRNRVTRDMEERRVWP